MTKKRRRRRPASKETAAGLPIRSSDEDAEPGEEAPDELHGGGVTIRKALGRGLLAVGSAPVLIAVPFLFALVAWLTLVAAGLQMAPLTLVEVFAIPPMPNVSFDSSVAQALYGNTVAGLVLTIGLFVARSLVWAPMVGLVIDVLEGARPSLFGVLRGLRALPTVLAANLLLVLGAGFFVNALLPLLSVLPVIGPSVGIFAPFGVPAAGVYFLVFAPASAVREGRGVLASLTRSARAARLRFPGWSHLIMCLLYTSISLPLFLFLAAQLGAADATANPSVAVWAVVLVATFVHMVFLAAFSYRWISVESQVPDKPVRRRPARERAPSGRGRR